MAKRPLPDILHQLRRLADPDGAEPLSDARLLRLFIGQRSEDAFTAIVRRHGPLVLRTCRQLLTNTHDADDAFQATFLVLARKAEAIGRGDLLAGWLYGVAHRIAVRVRVQTARRQVREQPLFDVAAATTSPEPGGRELWDVLHEEVVRLPAKYRQPVVLCYLESKTLEEAARLLDWPKGTVSGRLARARDLLQRRLIRRGVAVPAAGGVAVLVGTGSLTAAVPGELMRHSVKAALAFAAAAPAAGVISPPVLSLAEGVLQTMFVTKLKIIVAAVLIAAVVVTVGAGLTAAGLRDGREAVKPIEPPARQPDAPKQEKEEPDKKVDEPKFIEPALLKIKPLAADPKDDELHKLMKERFNTAQLELRALCEQMSVGVLQEPDVALDSAKRLKLAGLELYDNPRDKIALLEKYVDTVREIEKVFQNRFDAGKINIAVMQLIKYHRLDAEIELLRMKEKAGEKPAKP
jgi:RNA polymerase sigma factor (sigma-70 family)